MSRYYVRDTGGCAGDEWIEIEPKDGRRILLGMDESKEGLAVAVVEQRHLRITDVKFGDPRSFGSKFACLMPDGHADDGSPAWLASWTGSSEALARYIYEGFCELTDYAGVQCQCLSPGRFRVVVKFSSYPNP